MADCLHQKDFRLIFDQLIDHNKYQDDSISKKISLSLHVYSDYKLYNALDYNIIIIIIITFVLTAKAFSGPILLETAVEGNTLTRPPAVGRTLSTPEGAPPLLPWLLVMFRS